VLTSKSLETKELAAFESAKLRTLELCDILKQPAKGKTFEALSEIEQRARTMGFNLEGLKDMVAIQSELHAAYMALRRKLLLKASAIWVGGAIVVVAIAWYDALLWLREGRSALRSVIVVISGLGGGIGGYSIISRTGKFLKDRGTGKTALFTTIFSLLIPERDREYLFGDLDEEFRAVLYKSGSFKAYVHYYREIAGFIPPYLSRVLRRLFRRSKFSGMVQK